MDQKYTEDDLAVVTKRALYQIDAELANARQKFPRNTLMYLALAEEVGELANAMIEHRLTVQNRGGKNCVFRDDVAAEAIQVAAMAIRILTEGDSSIPEYIGDAEYRRTAIEKANRLQSGYDVLKEL